MTDSGPAKKFRFVGGELCLDFCNSVGGKREGRARENLHQYEDLLSWSQQAGLLGKRQAKALSRKASRRRRQAATVFRRAKLLREAVYRIFQAFARNRRPPEKDVARLNSELEAVLGRLRVARGKGADGFVWEWASSGQALDYPLGPLARSAADLLTHAGRLDHVCQCNGGNCGWLFLDVSKNHSRRWCDMRDCGNRAKIRRYRGRLRRKNAKALGAF